MSPSPGLMSLPNNPRKDLSQNQTMDLYTGWVPAPKAGHPE